MKKISLILLLTFLITSVYAEATVRELSLGEGIKVLTKESFHPNAMFYLDKDGEPFYFICFHPGKILIVEGYSSDHTVIEEIDYPDMDEYVLALQRHNEKAKDFVPLDEVIDRILESITSDAIMKTLYPEDYVKESSATYGEQEYTQETYQYVEQMPQFPGGDTELLNWVQKNLKYPDSAQGISGKVILKFVVTEFGDVEKIEVIQSLTPDCDRAAINLMKSSPKWKSGSQNGRPVSCYFTLPIPFKRNDFEKQTKKNEKKTWNF